MQDGKIKVLVVDDNDSLRDVIADILVELGYIADTAEDGLVALKKIRSDNGIDILLTDIKMPHLNGLDLVKIVKEEHPDIISIVMTGYVDYDIVVSVLRAGAYDFIPKPYETPIMAMIIERSAERRKMILENKFLFEELREKNKILEKQKKQLEQKIIIGNKIIEKRYKELKYINNVMKTINSSLDFSETIHFILTIVKEVVGADTVSVMILDETGKNLEVIDAIGEKTNIIGEKIEIGEGIAGFVAENEKALFMPNIDNVEEMKERFSRSNNYNAKSFISIPLITIKKGLIGVLNATDKKDNTPFTEEEFELLKTFSEQAATAIENSLIYKELESYYLETIKAISNAIEAKDEYTRGHSERVTFYSMELARDLNYSNEQIKIIEFGGILHDVGKIGIPINILSKPSKLTDSEFAEMKKHPVIGEEIVREIKFLKPCLPIIRSHHERLDGFGYPDALKEEEIPENVRIVTIADAFDAMTSDRPYRKALPLEEAIKRLKESAGTQFDKNLVDVFLNITIPRLKKEGRFI